MNTNKHILLIEDNPDDEALTLRALNKNNLAHNIIVKRDGQEALDFLETAEYPKGKGSNSGPHLILLDLKIPKINGLQVLKAIRSRNYSRHIPVVILSSSNEEQDIISSYELGANSYVRKPIDFQQFIETAKQLGLYWLITNEVPNG